jgi:signal transduction protein with GAF and PtsI domain
MPTLDHTIDALDMTRTPTQLIHALIRELSGAEEPKKLLDRILDAAVRMTEATSGSIILIDRATSSLSIEAARGFAVRVVKTTRLKIGKGITGWVAAHAKTVRVDDVRKDKRYVSLKKNIRSELASPLILNREVIGVINVDSTRIGAFSEEDEQAIETLATLSSRVIADALIHDRLRRKTRLLETLVRIGGELTALASSQRILDEVTASAADLIQARLAAVRLLDPSGERLELAAIHGGSREYAEMAPIPVGGSALGSVARSQIPLIIEDIPNDASYKFKSIAQTEGLRSMLAVPLVTAGRSIGVLAIYREKAGDFDEDAVTITVGLAGLAATALENARLFQFVIDSDKRIRQAEMRSTAREVSAELAHQIRNPLTVVRLLVAAR